jgi:hypothetical protein
LHTLQAGEEIRDDFPIEWEGDNYVSGVMMLKCLTLVFLFFAIRLPEV